MLVRLGDTILNLEKLVRADLAFELPDYAPEPVPDPEGSGASVFPTVRFVRLILDEGCEDRRAADSIEGQALGWWLVDSTLEQRKRAFRESGSLALDLVALYRRQPQL